MNMVSSSLQEEADVLCPKLMSQCWPDFYIHYIDIIEFDIVHDIRPSGRSRWLCFKSYVQRLKLVLYVLFILVLSKEELIYAMFPACREKQMVMLEMDGQMLNQFYIHYNDFVEVKSMNANLETCIWWCPAFRMKQTKGAYIECISVIRQCSLIGCIVLWGLCNWNIFRICVQYIGFEDEQWA